ncbi:MAG: RNA polymerase sigma factor [Ignavibacteriaceae bacterium]|jgi:RNA polymerase sigma-70 factor (ECF subfamily)|nr:RNA polymerase sigma factor [Ignavibacteriaceae bacterium]
MPEEYSDFDLVRRFLDGDEVSFNKLVRKYQAKIYWHARRMTGNHLDSDEIVQEVLLVLYDKLKNFNFQSSLFTWIYRITITRSINYIKKQKLRRFISFDSPENIGLSTDEDLVKNIEDKEKLKKLDRVLQKLPEKQREIFILRHFDELSYEEIAQITGKSVGGLKANYFHAFEKVNKLMRNDNE